MLETPDQVAKRLASAAPDAGGVTELARVEDELTPDGAWEAVGTLDRQIAWLQARKAKNLARAASEVPPIGQVDDRDWAQDELALMSAISPRMAAEQLRIARALAVRPRAAQLFSGGDISLAHVRVLLQETENLTEQHAREIDELILAEAPGRTPAAFRKIARRAVLARMSREEQAARIEQREAERLVSSSYDPDGIMGTLYVRLPSGQLALVQTTLNAIARAADNPDDDRSMDQKRADALVQAIAAAGEHGLTLAPEQRLKPAVQVVVALSTLTGADNQPAELNGHPIPAELAIRIAADPTGTWRRLITDPVGTVIDYGRTIYRPPPDLAEFVIGRDRTCVWPGCHQPARRTEIDHRRRWVDGGPTNAENLQCLCVGHHHCKEAGYHSALLDDGTIRWTTPTGRVYTRPPATYPTDTTNEAVTNEAGTSEDAPQLTLV